MKKALFAFAVLSVLWSASLAAQSVTGSVIGTVLDSSNQAWLIEMNPRVTPICHFSLANGMTLAGSLYKQMTGLRPPSKLAPINRGLIALFPDEIVRSPSSKYLQSCQHDVPWNEPEGVSSVLNHALRTGILRRARTCLERYVPALVGAFVRLGLADGDVPPFC